MKVGDLVKRRSTGEIDIVVEIREGRAAKVDIFGNGNGKWVRVGVNSKLAYISNYEVISEGQLK